MSGASGYGTETTLSRVETLRGRGYPPEVIAGNGHRGVVAGNGHQVVEELPPADAPPTCALPGCDEPLTGQRRKYHGPACAAEAERRRSHAKVVKESAKRAAARKAGPSRSSAPAAKAEPPSSSDTPRPGVVEMATQLLASGAVAEVQLEVDGATLVARAAR